GAMRDRKGLFLAANDGTLFLDEVAELPLEVQAALLRALEQRSVRSVGDEKEVPFTARVVAATHQNLVQACEAGRFREDLYGRLAHVVLQVPPLRSRRGEILSLGRHLAGRPLEFTPSAAEALLLWSWPRNVRELKALVTSYFAM